MERKGCFVYRVLGPDLNIAVRCAPSRKEDYSTDLEAKSGNMVCIDYMFSTKVGGPKFLRLADGSGWLFDEFKFCNSNVIVMEPVPVESGFWCFYVDNNPVGIGLRNHPIDKGSETDLCLLCQPMKTLAPQQKIYCDKKVTDGKVNFYRIQGTSAWVFDRRGDNVMLLPVDSIRSGLLAYQLLAPQAMRMNPKMDEEMKIPGCAASEGNIVIGDFLRHSPADGDSGPFLRLTNGIGWLHEFKRGDRMMKEVIIETGDWYFSVVNQGGIQMRKQPIDDFKYRFPTAYCHGDILVCDRRIVGANGVNFYRIKGTSGWVFDRQNGMPMLNPREAPSGGQSKSENNESKASLPAWTVDFVRGMACAIEGMHEVDLNEQGQIVSFCKEGITNAQINIHYGTRCIGTVIDHPEQGKTKLFRRDCSNSELAEIMRNPRFYPPRGSKPVGRNIDAEEETRNTLRGVDENLAKVEEWRRTLVDSIAQHDAQRVKNEKNALKLMAEHVEFCVKEKQRADDERAAMAAQMGKI